jgi:ribonucleotide reductase alpha subunit
MIKNKLTYDEALKNALKYFNGDDLAASVFISKYAISDEENNYLESTPDEMHYRMAKEFARIEEKMGGNSKLSEDEIYKLFNDWTIIPGGSVMNGLGNPNYIGSLSNCFVAQPPMDSYSSIMKNREIMVQLMKRRGGVGIDISNLRPSGAKVSNAAKTSTGAVSFMNVYSELTKEVALNGRRGALMISMSSKHPDVDEFIKVKQDLTKITGANISVKFDDEFMEAVLNDSYYIQRFPIELNTNDINIDDLPLNKKVYDGEKCYKKVRAKEIWKEFVTCSWKTAEPGIMYEDKHLNYSPDSVYEQYKGITTNPCVAGDTVLYTDKGNITIKELVERYNNGETFKVLSYDIDESVWEYQNVTNALLTRKNTNIIEITTKGYEGFDIINNEKKKKIKLTPDHKVYTKNRGWVRACELTKNDFLVMMQELLFSFIDNIHIDEDYIEEIVEIENEDVYDITVEKNHNFFANGILVHNCGEIFMDPNNSCRLMHINFANFVVNPFTEDAYFDYERLIEVAALNMRLCDDLVELELEYVTRIIDKIKSNYTEENKTELELWETIRDKGEKSRRAGCGGTGLADAIAMLNVKLGSEQSYDIIESIFNAKMLGELKMQSLLAKERGCFDGFDFNKEFTEI